MDRLLNKVSIITEASGGIGTAMSRLFASEGAKVVITDVMETGIHNTALSLVDSGLDNKELMKDVP